MKIGLGSAQFGGSYGISNRSGQASQAEVEAILAAAARDGVSVIDTAPAYGASETVLGACLGPTHPFRLVTKTPVLGASEIGDRQLASIRESFDRSLERLRVQRVDALLLHRADDLLLPGGRRVLETLREFVEAGRVRRLGVSVYDGPQIDRVLEVFTPGVIQLPLNAFDQRLARSGHLDRLKALGVEIHARSIFLQGLMTMAAAALPAHFAPMLARFASYRGFLSDRGLSPIEGALAYISQVPAVDVAIVGVTSKNEWAQIASAAQAVENLRIDFSPFAIEDEALINPSKWKLEEQPS